jgi:hypothetical protein
LIRKFAGKMPQAKLCPERGRTLREPAQSKRMSRFHKSNLLRIFLGENAADQSEHPDQAPTFTPTVRIPQCEGGEESRDVKTAK